MVKAFLLLPFLNNSSSWEKKVTHIVSDLFYAMMLQSIFHYLISDSYMKNMLRFATGSEIMSVTRPHTIRWCCAHYCSIPMKNVIYSYLFITEKQRWGARSRLRGLPLPSHTQWSRPKQKILVVNRLEAADCEEWFCLCVFVCVCVLLNEWRHESGNRPCVFLCAHARGQIIDSYYRNGDSLTLFMFK